MSTPLMPKATAVWLVENTGLSFDQIADFCKLHPLEVKAIADGDSAQGIKGLDPVTLGLCTQIDLDFEVARAAKERPVVEDRGATLLPAAVTTAAAEAKAEAEHPKQEGDELDVSTVFAKLKQLGGKTE